MGGYQGYSGVALIQINMSVQLQTLRTRDYKMMMMEEVDSRANNSREK